LDYPGNLAGIENHGEKLSPGRHPECFYRGVQSWFDSTRHDPELIEGQGFACGEFSRATAKSVRE
jgi:hypothetical protein